MTAVIPDGGWIVRLREALRTGDEREVREAAEPLIERLYAPLLDYCDRLVRSGRRPIGVEGDDLAQEAWATALRRLASEESEGVRDEFHFERLLRRIAKSRFLDCLDRQTRRNEAELDSPPVGSVDESDGWYDELKASETAEGDLFFGGEGTLLPLVEALFAGDDVFRYACRRTPRRRPKYYRALVLVSLGDYARNEIGAAQGDAAELLRRYVALLGIAAEDWAAVEAAAYGQENGAALLAAVNARCGTAIADRAVLSVLRYELYRLAG